MTDRFIASREFTGSKAGYVFKSDHLGVGYYRDFTNNLSNKSGCLVRDGNMITENNKFSVTSKYEAELWNQVNCFIEKTVIAKSLQIQVSSCIPSDLQADIDKMINKYQEKISNAELFIGHSSTVQKRLVHLISIQDDLDRQKKSALVAIEEQTTGQAMSQLARKEPLDAESEKKRRAIVSKLYKVQNIMGRVESRVSLNKAIFSCSASHRQETLRASDYFNQWSRTPPKTREQTAKEATRVLFRALTSGFDRVRDFQSYVEHISEKSTNLVASQSIDRSKAHKNGTESVLSKSRMGPLSKSKIISPLRTKHLVSPLISRRNPSDMRASILERHHSLRRMTSELSREHRSMSTIFYTRGLASRDLSNSQSQIPDWRSKGKNQLYSNSKAEQLLVTASRANDASSAIAKSLFSSPITSTKARDWNAATEREKAILNINVPTQLKTINLADATTEALKKFGLTPEKLAEGRDIISRDAAESTAPLISFSDKKPAPKFSLLTSSSTGASPFTSSQSPKRVSQTINQSTPSAPALTIQIDYKSVLTKFYKDHAPEMIAEIESALNKYQGKEAEMFVSLAKRYNTSNALNEEFESRVKNIDKHDYSALTKLYLQVFNPSRANDAEKLLMKNKGKEETMFADLSSRWFTCNPLQKVNLPAVPSAESSSAAQNLLAPIVEEPSTSEPTPNPYVTESKLIAGSSEPIATVTDENDYHKLLTDFYQRHNPQKVSEVTKTLENYKGREHAMFGKLAVKYKTTNPLDDVKSASTTQSSSATTSSFGFGNLTASLGASKSPFGTTPLAQGSPSVSFTSSAFGAGGALGQNKSLFGNTQAATAPALSPFGSAVGSSHSPFGGSSIAPQTKSPFGSAGVTSAFNSNPSPFGGASTGSAFGGGVVPAATPLSGGQFGLAPSAGAAFAQATGSTKFGGRNPRDILASFYQTHNPSKVNEVDTLLAKYAGREEQMFLALAKKYNLDPSMFGVSAAQPTATPTMGGMTFGTPAPMGFASTAGFGGAAPAAGFNAGGFGSTATGGFGSIAQTGGFSALASSPATGFGGSVQAAPFGSARR
jgi:hypothetical protein